MVWRPAAIPQAVGDRRIRLGNAASDVTALCFNDAVLMSRAGVDDLEVLTAFLREADLTLSGLDAPSVRLWIARDQEGRIVGTAGYELSADGTHVLIRSVAVDPARRASGRGSELARFAFVQAAAEGASTAWLFSRRSGPFWQRLGFQPADRERLAAVLADTHQVRLFRQTGQLAREVAWSRSLEEFGWSAAAIVAVPAAAGASSPHAG